MMPGWRQTMLWLIICVTVLTSAAEQKEEQPDIDIGQILQMGMQMGKTFLGDEGIEKMKKGDFTQLYKLGEQFLGEQGMNDLMNAAVDSLVQLKPDKENNKEAGKEEEPSLKEKVDDEL